ncbi:MAG: deoxyribodipyrimidine photo-lyase, partial [Muriicola sp.]|nr:deoxyribodipyrimidine photo-lyase [Muriicola sp.]
MREKITIFWFRRDLRLEDNHGLFNALKGNYQVLPIFIFDPHILEELPENDARVSFIYKTLQQMSTCLQQDHKCTIALFHKDPVEVFEQLADTYDVQGVYTNEDYEPYAIKRDNLVKQELGSRGIKFHTFKDQVIFAKNEVVKDNGEPYVVYTPYMKKWKEKFYPVKDLPLYDSNALLDNLI